MRRGIFSDIEGQNRIVEWHIARIRNGDFCGLLPNRPCQRLRFASCPAIVCLLHGGLIRTNGKDMSDPTETLFFPYIRKGIFFFHTRISNYMFQIEVKRALNGSHFEYQSHDGFDGVKIDIKFELALLVSSVEGFQAFMVAANVGIPVLRISMAWLLKEWLKLFQQPCHANS